jgi:hypothetical protein
MALMARYPTSMITDPIISPRDFDPSTGDDTIMTSAPAKISSTKARSATNPRTTTWKNLNRLTDP